MNAQPYGWYFKAWCKIRIKICELSLSLKGEIEMHYVRNRWEPPIDPIHIHIPTQVKRKIDHCKLTS
jgi:hypothetical protein